MCQSCLHFLQPSNKWDFYEMPFTAPPPPPAQLLLPLFPPSRPPAFPPHPASSISAVIFSTSCRKRAISGSSVSNTRPTPTDLMEIYRREAAQLRGAFLKSFPGPVLRMECIYPVFAAAATLSTLSVTYSTDFFLFPSFFFFPLHKNFSEILLHSTFLVQFIPAANFTQLKSDTLVQFY